MTPEQFAAVLKHLARAIHRAAASTQDDYALAPSPPDTNGGEEP
ncbi:hypothetical protein [Streptomyces sulphureus]|nr:hypothetical protein [Streptomyces sulphureus]